MMLLAQATTQPSAATDIILQMIPWVLVFLFLWFFLFRVIRRQNKGIGDRWQQTCDHMTAVEAKLDRLIELSERQNRQ